MRATAPLHPPVRYTPPPEPGPAPERAYVRPPRPSYRRAFAVGALVSILLHLLVLVLAWKTRVLVVPASEVSPIVAVRGGERTVMRVERIVPVPDATPGLAEPVRRDPVEAAPERRVDPSPDEPGPARADPWENLSPAERLRARPGDPRLWVRPEAPPVPEPTEMDRVRARIAGRLGEWNDSVAAEAERAANALDWTVKDKDGGKWGISPGKLHLGGLTLPLPLSTAPSPSAQREAAEERARRNSEIHDQNARARADENFEERVKAIRERKDRERQQKGGSGSSGTGGSGSGATGTDAGGR